MMNTNTEIQDRLRNAMEYFGGKKCQRILHGCQCQSPTGRTAMRLLPDAWLRVDHHHFKPAAVCPRGPSKHLRVNGRDISRSEIALGPHFRSGSRMMLDEEALEDLEALAISLLRLSVESDDHLGDWIPPSVELLAAWLSDTGRDVAVDESGDLRLVLTRKGCEGQVRIRRETGLLCFEMPLGQWADLTPEVIKAMYQIVEQANDHTRLADVNCGESENYLRCEGKVDLTGLLWNERPAVVEMWQTTVPLAIDALEVVLRRIGLELEVLSNPSGANLVPMLSAAGGVA